MNPEEKKRMLHIRLDREVHKDLRRAAVECDISLQEIVAEAVEKEVEHLEAQLLLDRKRVELERVAGKYELEIIEQVTTELKQEREINSEDEGQSVSSSGSIAERLEGIEHAILRLSEQIDELRNLLVESD